MQINCNEEKKATVTNEIHLKLVLLAAGNGIPRMHRLFGGHSADVRSKKISSDLINANKIAVFAALAGIVILNG